jgi:hypothetical protein
MTEGLRALLEGVLDYAGLFPPAQLPLEDALRNYACYRGDADAWMLGRFVMPVVRLAELDPYMPELFASGKPLALAALGRGGDTAEAWAEGIRADAQALAGFRARHPGRVRIDVYETRLPDPRAATPAIRETLGGDVELFLETKLPSSGAAFLSDLGAGFKLRCGGVTAAAFPTAEQVAAAIIACRTVQVPLKLTAGLHHPLPRFDLGIQATMHGFINVLLAGVFADASQRELVELLRDTDPAHFAFDDGGVRWKDRQASVAQVRAARREMIVSFGSCSFDEPRDDLRALGWL